jgi:FkbM family methyltransferase
MRIRVGPASVLLEDKGDRICKHMAAGAEFEPETLEVWGRLCLASKGRVVIDVGAYSGLFTIAAALLECWPHAFEPMPRNKGRVVSNLMDNGGIELRNRAKVHEVALSDREGETVIHWNPSVPGLTSGASLVNRNLGAQRIEALPVVVRTLDSFGFQDVAAIKIDVERAEPEVLRGARETIARCKPTLFVEVLGEKEEAAVLQAVEGYQVAKRLDTRNWMMVPA